MPVFTRRRLQRMLDELGPQLTPAKARDLLVRLEHQSTRDALAAEIELGLLWAIGQVAHLRIEPRFAGPSRPDALSNDLFPSAATAVEITALSDDTFSGKPEMERAANIICQFADRIRKGASKHLHFSFAEKRYYEKGRYHRVRCITPRFALTPPTSGALRGWLEAADWPSPQ